MKRAKLSILFIAFCSMINLSMSSIIAKLVMSFPDIPVTRIQLVMTIPNLTGIGVTLLSGVLMTRMRKKPLVLVYLLLGIFTVMPLLIHGSFPLLLVAAVLLGIFTGTNSVCNSLISELFEGEERAALMGLNTGIGQFGAVFFSLLGGVLATRSWWNLYAVFLFFIPLFICSILFLPKGQKPERAPVEKKSPSGKLGLGKAVPYIIMISVFFCAMFSFALNNSLLLEERGYTSTALAGASTAVGFAAGGIVGLFFGRLNKLLGRFLMPVGALLALAGFGLFAFTQHLVFCFLASIFIGSAMSVMFPATLAICSFSVPPQSASLAISLAVVFQGIGSSSSAVVITGLASLFGLYSATEKMLVSTALSLLLFAVHLILALRRKPAVKNA